MLGAAKGAGAGASFGVVAGARAEAGRGATAGPTAGSLGSSRRSAARQPPGARARERTEAGHAGASMQPTEPALTFERVDVQAELVSASRGFGRGGVAFYDRDCDGVLDLLGIMKANARRPGPDSIGWQRGLGQGRFGAAQRIVALDAAVGVSTSDHQMPSFGPIRRSHCDGDPDLVAVIGTGPLARELRLINDCGQFSPKLGVESQETAFASIAWHRPLVPGGWIARRLGGVLPADAGVQEHRLPDANSG